MLSLLVVVIVAILGCSPRGSLKRDRASDLHGRILPAPLTKPDFVLSDMNGEPFDFLEETDGFVTLLFFGYTYCPDVCPIHMSSIASVLQQMTPVEAAKFRVVFVTTDPERDTPARLQQWLGAFDRNFIGLTGPLAQVNEIQTSIGLGASFREDLPNGEYGMAHAAQVLAYTTDNLAHVAYPFGTRQADWAHDLPLLIRGLQ